MSWKGPGLPGHSICHILRTCQHADAKTRDCGKTGTSHALRNASRLNEAHVTTGRRCQRGDACCSKPHPHSKQRQPDCPTHGVVNPLSSGHLAYVRSSSFQAASISASCSSRRWHHPARRHRRHRPCGDPSCFFALPSSSSETSIRHSAPR